MSLSTVITLALVLKKFARKGALAKNFRAKKGIHHNDDHDKISLSSCSTDDEGVDVSDIIDKKLKTVVVKETIISSNEQLPISNVQVPDESDVSAEQNVSYTTSETDTLSSLEEDIPKCDLAIPVNIRDFAYPVTSPMHRGETPRVSHQMSRQSLSSPDFHGCHARALYDFVPETEYEIGMKASDPVWVQYRQCPGWLIADVNDETGLIPESYVELL
ncbi:uncharacterized protein BYT42DRAFT_571494 [Radiomyces spectabilis]|uniref:uncharacterized protein n=1 Tax=Radiomyces spectabilis TaxID=64574 RepID=UPI00221F3DDF|nr:uncharacterized protein BYT42DRAFT_571494 [Radiomyces spectabilis]KAI8377752.1 hypothetical protein BYT42DRAFT_571494 [Radiomyces spectabilis]